MLPPRPSSQSGYLAISSVLVIAAVIVTIAIGTTLSSINEGQSSLAEFRGADTLGFVEGCLEDALLKLRASSSYAGGSITRPEGTCTITVSPSGSVYTVTATTTATNYRRSVQAVVTRGSSLTITSWKEL